MIRVATIQFADRFSESIKDKNLMEVDGKPLWRYNADEAKALKDKCASCPSPFYTIVQNYICTNYDEAELPAEGLGVAERIPRHAFDVGKCLLSERIRDATAFLNKIYAADAYLLLLGNVRSWGNVMDNCLMAWYAITKWADYTGLLTVANFSMYNPNRVFSIGDGSTAHLLRGSANGWRKDHEPLLSARCEWRVGEEKEQSKDCSWFFDGGAMVMRSDNKTDFRYDAFPTEYPTQFPFLGDMVYAYKQPPMQSVELDAAWQLPMLTDSFHGAVVRREGE